MSMLSRTILTAATMGALALSAPLLADVSHGDREARHGHHGHMMMARSEHREGRHDHHRAGKFSEERQARMEEMRVRHLAMRLHWDTLSDAEKENYEVQARMRIEERRAAWEAMTPEEREAKRQEMCARHGEKRS